MQLKLTRTKAEKGLLRKRTVYQLYVLLYVTPEEDRLFEQNRKWKAEIRPLVVESGDDTTFEYLEFLTFRDLTKGRQFEEDDPATIVALEAAIAEACKKNLQSCKRSESFDGQGTVVDIDEDEITIVATG